MIHYFDKTKKIIGDVMPFYDGSKYHLFYLLNGENNDHKNIEHAVSEDGIIFNQVETAFVSKNNSELGGGNLFTGSFFKIKDKYHAMITYYDPNQPLGREFIAHYISNDCRLFVHTKTIGPNKYYYSGQQRDFRDPNIIKNPEGGYLIFFLGNNAHYPPKSNFDPSAFKTGIIKTRDFKKFKILPNIEGVNDECVDYIKIGGIHYMIGCHRYACSNNLFGPYTIINHPLEYNVRAGKTFKINNGYYYLAGFNEGPPTLLKKVYKSKNDIQLKLRFADKLIKKFRVCMKFDNSKTHLIKFKMNQNEKIQFADSLIIEFKNDCLVIIDKDKRNEIKICKRNILIRIIIERRFVELEFDKSFVYSTTILGDIKINNIFKNVELLEYID